MTILRRPSSATAVEHDGARPAKRIRFAENIKSKDAERTSQPPASASTVHRPHPLLLKPSGNALLNPATAMACRSGGLGVLARLPDALVLELLAHLPATELVRVQGASRALLAFTRHQALWKDLYIAEANGALERWDGDWRRTYMAAFLAPPIVVDALYADSGNDKPLPLPTDGITAPDLCSDVLYQPHLCAAPLTHFFRSTGALDNLPRADARGLTPAEFAARFAHTSTPVILDGLTEDWPAARTPGWALPTLAARFPEARFRAEAVHAPMSVYERYCVAAGCDESPLYLFDAEFARRTDGALAAEAPPPPLFGADLFRVMGAERPDYRWLVRPGS
jgi:hypothetical protein